MWRLIAVALVALVAVQCADNPAGASPAPFTQTLTGTVTAAGTSRQVLAIPRSGNLVLTLSWQNAVDLNLYLASSSCGALNPKSQCNILLQSNRSTSEESLARPVSNGETFSVFIENTSSSSSSSYTLNIRIQDPHLDSAL